MRQEEADKARVADANASRDREVAIRKNLVRWRSADGRLGSTLALLVALLVHAVLLLVPLPGPRDFPEDTSPLISIELQAFAQPQPPAVSEPMPQPEEESEPLVAEPIDPAPQRETSAVAAPVPPTASGRVLDVPAPSAPRVLAPDGRLLVAPVDDRFDVPRSDRAPERQYDNVVPLHRYPTVSYAPTRFAQVYAPDGHAGQVAAFHYPALRVLYLFPQLSFLIAAPAPRTRTCMRDVAEIDDGVCIDAGRNTLEWIRSRPIDR